MDPRRTSRVGWTLALDVRPVPWTLSEEPKLAAQGRTRPLEINDLVGINLLTVLSSFCNCFIINMARRPETIGGCSREHVSNQFLKEQDGRDHLALLLLPRIKQA